GAAGEERRVPPSRRNAAGDVQDPRCRPVTRSLTAVRKGRAKAEENAKARRARSRMGRGAGQKRRPFPFRFAFSRSLRTFSNRRWMNAGGRSPRAGGESPVGGFPPRLRGQRD